jgi:hypothetical protein
MNFLVEQRHPDVASRLANLRAHASPANPPPTITTCFGDVLLFIGCPHHQLPSVRKMKASDPAPT